MRFRVLASGLLLAALPVLAAEPASAPVGPQAIAVLVDGKATTTLDHAALAAMPRASAEIGLVAFFTSPMGLRVAAEILVYSCAGGLFVVAWIFQFYGHKVEGKKPSFLKDLQFLLVGPVWLLNFVYKRMGLPT